MHIGVVAVQGAVSEHIRAIERALGESGAGGGAFYVKNAHDVKSADALVFPGGESTTISKFIENNDMREAILARSRGSLPILGTCAGSILLAKKFEQGAGEAPRTLGLMEMKVSRNAFGRQRESFECPIKIDGIERPDDAFHAVFIRAPEFIETWGKCRAIAKMDGRIVAARQGNIIATAFHPELTDDIRVHKLLLEMIR